MWQVGSVCYHSKVLANAASASSVRGSIVDFGGVPHVVNVTQVDDGGAEYTLQPIGGGTNVVQAVELDPQPCGLITLADAQPIGWAVFAGWIGIYLIRLLWTSAGGGRDDS